MIVDYLDYEGALREMHDLSRLEIRYALEDGNPKIEPWSKLDCDVPHTLTRADTQFGPIKGDAAGKVLQEVRLVFDPRHVTGPLRLPVGYHLAPDRDQWDEWYGWRLRVCLKVERHRKLAFVVSVFERPDRADELRHRICLDEPRELSDADLWGEPQDMWSLLAKRRK